MTSYRRITSRTLNRVVQQDSMLNMIKQSTRDIHHNNFSVPDASNNRLLLSTGSLYSAKTSSKLTFDGIILDVSANFQVNGNTNVQQLNVSANFQVDGDTHVKKLDVLDNLTVSGNTLCSGNILCSGNTLCSGNILSYGTIQTKQFLPGQVVNTMMLNAAELEQTQYDFDSGDTYTIFSYSYTPKFATSYLLIEYQTVYTLNGVGDDTIEDDTIEAYLYVVNPNRIAATFQKWIGGTGGGTRSGTIFPIVGRYTNTDLTAKAISVDVFNNTDVDTISVNADNSTWLKITEIGR